MMRLDMYLLHMTEGVNKYRQSMNQGTIDERVKKLSGQSHRM